MPDTFHLYSDLAWLWPLWGDARTEYADYCQHLTALIHAHPTRPSGDLQPGYLAAGVE
ncbi:MAG: hypothetical protein K0A95_02290 [Chromatiales bacterium]|nr:hypothetical protein [Chromatiales bacterium]